MCEVNNDRPDYRPNKVTTAGIAAGDDLARLIERGLGYTYGHIDPVALRLFIKAYWSRVSKLAHIIHDEPT